MRRLIFLVVLLLTLLFSRLTYAQNSPEAQKIELPRTSLNLDLSDSFRNHPPRYDPIEDLVPRHYAPGEIRLNYSGIESAIVKRLQSEYNSLFNKSVSAFISGNSLTPMQADEIYFRNSCAWADLEAGQWWMRSFRESLIQEKGGAGEPQTQEVGQTIEVIKLFGVVLFNDGRVYAGDFNLKLDAYRGGELDPPKQESLSKPPTFVESGFKLSSLAHSRYYDLSLRPSVTFKLTSSDPRGYISTVSMDFRAKIFEPYRHQELAYLTITTIYSPAQNAFEVYANLNIYIW